MTDPKQGSQEGPDAEPDVVSKNDHSQAGPEIDEAPDEWRSRFPSHADFNFNYWTLLSKADRTAIAKAGSSAPNERIAVVGAGVAGLTVARELLRCGHQNIDIYEATDRIGGRTYSIPSQDGITSFEMGAMRLPFFWPHDKHGRPTGAGSDSRNCVPAYYCQKFEILTENFPNPGAAGFATGVYINRGRGVDRPKSWRVQRTISGGVSSALRENGVVGFLAPGRQAV